jgi:hypothetical protein
MNRSRTSYGSGGRRLIQPAVLEGERHLVKVAWSPGRIAVIAQRLEAVPKRGCPSQLGTVRCDASAADRSASGAAPKQR